MKIILNNFEDSITFTAALAELVDGAETLSVAVSYLQVGGWELFKGYTQGLNLERMRIVCTDQLGITHPAAVRRAMESNVQIRNFTGNVVYHPKVFLAYDNNGRPIRFLLGSANLSLSAFSTSIEAAVLSEDADELDTVHRWFNHLFDHQSAIFTPELLEEMDVKWRLAAAMRAHNRLQIRRNLVIEVGPGTVPVGPEDIDTLEDILATLQHPIGLLNIDYASNNVRNLSKVREVASSIPEASSKQFSELKLLGLVSGRVLTALGRAVADSQSDEDAARLWCAWLRNTSDAHLMEINDKLIVAKRVFSQFWRLSEDVRDYFLTNAHSPQDRRTLQTIELLCNTHEAMPELSLSDIRELSRLLESEKIPAYIQADISNYFANKGQRSWDTTDRCIIPLAWRETGEIEHQQL